MAWVPPGCADGWGRERVKEESRDKRRKPGIKVRHGSRVLGSVRGNEYEKARLLEQTQHLSLEQANCLPLWKVIVLVCSGCPHKGPLTGWLANNRNFSQLWRLGSPKSGCWCSRALVRTLPPAADYHLLVPSHGGKSKSIPWGVP